MTVEIGHLKAKLRETWMSGDYDQFSRYMEAGAWRFFESLRVQPGTRLLDVGCGAGQLALLAARAGAVVTGCDIAPNWIAKARVRAAAEGLDVNFEEGDAEALPYADGSFDMVVSLIGAMFAPRPDRVSAELTRVCRPGGMIAMANWTPAGFIGQMFKTIAKFISPNGMPSPVLWGDEPTVRERLREGTSAIACSPRLYRFEYPFPPGDVVEFFREHYGPMNRAFASLNRDGQAELRQALTLLWSSQNQATNGGTRVDSAYLEVIAIRA